MRQKGKGSQICCFSLHLNHFSMKEPLPVWQLTVRHSAVRQKEGQTDRQQGVAETAHGSSV
eukprot:scaffold2611_cov253-Ochromonas_danica.AAC.3